MSTRPQKYLFVGFFIVIFAMSFLINNHWRGDWSPNSSDEQGYIGAANRIVLFNNKTLKPPPDSPNLFSYAMGVTSVVTGVEVTLLFRIFHVILLALIILSFYRLGQTYNRKTGVFLASLVTFYYAPSFYVGLWTMVPSLFMFLALPNIFLALFQSRFWLASLWFVLLTFIFWWAAGPFLIAIFLYLIFRFFLHETGRRYWYLFPVALLAIFFFFYEVVRGIGIRYFPSTGFPDWYWGKLWSIVPLYFLAPIGLAVVLRLKGKNLHRLGTLAITLISTNILFGVGISTYAHVRTTIFLWIGAIILIALFLSNILRYVSRVPAIASVVLLFVIFVNTVAVSNFSDAIGPGAGGLTTNPAEQKAVGWLRQDDSNPLVISDYATMLLITFYLKSANAKFFSDGNISSDFFLRTNDGLELDFQKVYAVLARKTLRSEDIAYIRNLKKRGMTSDVYVLISPRTREALEEYSRSHKISGKLLVVPSSTVFEGERKFASSNSFRLVYNQDDVQLYLLLR